VDVLAIRGAIATVLAPLLGTYTLANGATTDALVVRDPGQGLAAGTTVSGLEVVISSVPELEEQAQYRYAPFLQVWNVFVQDWGGGDLEEAVATLQSAFPGSSAVLLAVLEDQGPKRQAQLRLPSNRNSNQLPATSEPTTLVKSVNGAIGHVSLGLADLDDVDDTGLVDDAVLVWDASSSSWKVNIHTTLTLTDGGHW
jgi:hypothetical protein